MHRNSIVFQLGAADLGAAHFAISPCHELIRAVRVLHRPNQHPLQWGWLRRVRRRVPAESFGVLSAVVRPRGYMPDFFTALLDADTTPDEDFAHLRGTPVRRVRAELVDVRTDQRRHDPVLEDMIARPRAAITRIADAAQDVWDAILAPYWEQLHRLLVGDIARRSRIMSSAGLGAMLDDLHERVAWDGTELRVRTRERTETVDCAGTGLTLVPSVMATPFCTAQTNDPHLPALFYPVHGMTEMWSSDPTGGSARRLDALLGEGRARVLRALDAPRSTSETGAHCDLAVSTASHHLAVLREAGLVDSTRDANTVLHSRTLLGDALCRM